MSDRIKTFFAIGGGIFGLVGGFFGLFGSEIMPRAFAQTDTYLARRLDQIEQRFYGIESRLNRIESDTRVVRTAPPSITNPSENEIAFLRTQIESLRMRLGEAECGLLRVDERTLPAASRVGKKGDEPCRRDWGTPVRLSARPGQ